MVPFALFVSLSANDNVLPTTVNDSMGRLYELKFCLKVLT